MVIPGQDLGALDLERVNPTDGVPAQSLDLHRPGQVGVFQVANPGGCSQGARHDLGTHPPLGVGIAGARREDQVSASADIRDQQRQQLIACNVDRGRDQHGLAFCQALGVGIELPGLEDGGAETGVEEPSVEAPKILV